MCDVQSIRTFCNLTRTRSISDETTILNVRHLFDMAPGAPEMAKEGPIWHRPILSTAGKIAMAGRALRGGAASSLVNFPSADRFDRI
jgi:hypothetical protein